MTQRSDLGYIVDCRPGPSDYAWFWRPGSAGYTSNLNEAGLYTREEFERIVGRDCAAMAFVPQEVAEGKVRATVLFRDLGVGHEGQRREEIRAEREGATLRAVFG